MAEIRAELQLSWWVADAGYSIWRARVLRPNESVDKKRPQENARLRTELPPGTFLDFARMKRTGEAAVEFSNLFGDLWSPIPQPRSLNRDFFAAVKKLEAFVDVGNCDWSRGWTDEVRKVFELSGEGMKGIRFQLGWSEGRPTMLAVADTLLGALYVQAAEAIALGQRFEPCTNCGKHVLLHSKSKGGPRTFCSERCSLAHFRGRKAEAVEMLAAGKPVAEVAEAIGSAVSTVTGWAEQFEQNVLKYAEAVNQQFAEKPKLKRHLSLDNIETTESEAELERLREVANARQKLLDADPVEPYSQLEEEPEPKPKKAKKR